jgi:hypothetical protein
MKILHFRNLTKRWHFSLSPSKQSNWWYQISNPFYVWQSMKTRCNFKFVMKKIVVKNYLTCRQVIFNNNLFQKLMMKMLTNYRKENIQTPPQTYGGKQAWKCLDCSLVLILNLKHYKSKNRIKNWKCLSLTSIKSRGGRGIWTNPHYLK